MSDFVDYAGTRDRVPCRVHPQIFAVVDVHNLRRDEHMVLCSGCFVMWLRNASFQGGVTNALTEALATVAPFASEVQAEHEATERERREAKARGR